MSEMETMPRTDFVQDILIGKIHRYIFLALAVAGYVQVTIGYVNQHVCTVFGSYYAFALSYWAIVAVLMYDFRWKLQYVRITNVAVNLAFFCLTTAAGFFVEEISWNESLGEMSGKSLRNNLLLEGLLLIGLLLVIQRIAAAYTLFMAINFTYGLINYYVLMFKGHPPLVGDFLAAGTAVEVMREYDYTIGDGILQSLYLMMAYFVLRKYLVPMEPRFVKGIRWMLRRKIRQTLGHRIGWEIVFRVLGIAATLCLWGGMIGSGYIKRQGFQINGWAPIYSFHNLGAPLTLMTSYYNLHMEEPENYSAREAEKSLEAYGASEGSGASEMSEASDAGDADGEDRTGSASAQTKEQPTVIVIMNESFSDLSALGEFESDEYLSRYHNLNSCVMKGQAYVSVVGGGTCNSEFEFLTGSSMAFIGSGVYPYTSYNLTRGMSLAKIMKEKGYQTVALHPSTATNWNRNKVYPQLGFDSFLSVEDAPEEGWDYLRGYVSDASDYEKVKEIYEESRESEEPLFLFNVTIQNHGGYTGTMPDALETVNVGEEYRSYTDVVNYMTLIRNADEAIGELLDYFAGQEDPVIVCFYGDHEPGISGDFRAQVRNIQGKETVEERQQLHQTPYFIWANYDTGIRQVHKDLSLNYLASNLLEVLGIETSYTSYLLDLENSIPIVNTEGYETADGQWHELSESNDRLEQYRQIQYYELNEKK